jgi:hypothetical protein
MELTMENPTEVQVATVRRITEAEGHAGNSADQTSLDLMARTNPIRFSLDDILLASAEIHKLPPEARNRNGRTRCLASVFHGQRQMAIALNARLEAMARLVAAGKIPCWVLPLGANGFQMIAEPVFLAAAKAPLSFIDGEAYFEPAVFVTLVLEHASVHGHA